jgi:hypothetical protein
VLKENGETKLRSGLV